MNSYTNLNDFTQVERVPLDLGVFSNAKQNPCSITEDAVNIVCRTMLTIAILVIASPAPAQVTFYDQEDFRGRAFRAESDVENFHRLGYNNRPMSAIVIDKVWEVCPGEYFSGQCVTLQPGHYPSLAKVGLYEHVTSIRLATGTHRDDSRYRQPYAKEVARIVLFEGRHYSGRPLSTGTWISDVNLRGLNDGASSAKVLGERWEVCDGANFTGRCTVLRPGRYPNLSDMGLLKQIAAVRVVHSRTRIHDLRYAPLPAGAPDYRRRDEERLYEANVTSTRAVLGTSEQLCWIEREQIPKERSTANLPGAIIGGIIGGIIGHQVIHGSKQGIATVGGAVAGAAVGVNVKRNESEQQDSTQDVERCENVPGEANLDYWEVTYTFRGVEHRVDMVSPPGATITVNENGEPRV